MHVARNLEAAFGARAKVAPALILAHEELGLLGRKGGSGFYLYDKKGKVPHVNPIISRRFRPSGKLPSARDILDRCLLAMLLEAAECLHDGTVASASDCDLAMVTGTGFPPERGGLIRWARQVGLPDIINRCERLVEQGLTRFTPTPALHALSETSAEPEYPIRHTPPQLRKPIRKNPARIRYITNYIFTTASHIMYERTHHDYRHQIIPQN